jgi:hypothetical protein
MNPLVIVLLGGALLAWALGQRKGAPNAVSPRAPAPPMAAPSPRAAAKDVERQLTANLTSMAVSKALMIGNDAINKGGAAIPSSVPVGVSATYQPAVQAQGDMSATDNSPPPMIDDSGAVENTDSGD